MVFGKTSLSTDPPPDVNSKNYFNVFYVAEIYIFKRQEVLDPTISFTPLLFWLKHVLFDANTVDSNTRTCTDISKNKRPMSSSNCITHGCKNIHA